MIEENKIITLDNNEKYLILTKETINNNNFVLGIKITDEKPINEFKAFLEHENIFEEINDESVLNIIVHSFMINRIQPN